MVEGESASIQKDPGSLGCARDDTRKRHAEQDPKSRADQVAQRIILRPRAKFGPSPSILSFAGRGEEKDPGFFAAL